MTKIALNSAKYRYLALFELAKSNHLSELFKIKRLKQNPKIQMAEKDNIVLNLLLQAQAMKPNKQNNFRITENSSPEAIEVLRLYKDGFLDAVFFQLISGKGTVFVNGITRAGRELLKELQQK